MSITLAHPFRIDSNGSAVTVEQGTLRHAAELAGHLETVESRGMTTHSDRALRWQILGAFTALAELDAAIRDAEV